MPSQTLRTNLERWREHIADGATLVSLAKGIELGSLMRMSQVIVSVTGVQPGQVAVISGPNLADEVGRRATGSDSCGLLGFGSGGGIAASAEHRVLAALHELRCRGH